MIYSAARAARAATVAIAADQQQHLRRGIAEQRAVVGDLARQMVVDHHRRDRGDQADRGGEQRLGDARRDHGEIGGVRSEMPMKAFMMPHTVPNRPTNGAVAPMVASMPVPRAIRRDIAASIRSSRSATRSLKPSSKCQPDSVASRAADCTNCATASRLSCPASASVQSVSSCDGRRRRPMSRGAIRWSSPATPSRWPATPGPARSSPPVTTKSASGTCPTATDRAAATRCRWRPKLPQAITLARSHQGGGFPDPAAAGVDRGWLVAVSRMRLAGNPGIRPRRARQSASPAT